MMNNTDENKQATMLPTENEKEPWGNYDEERADIRVIGVGGGGGNAVNRMVQAKIPGIEFITLNTDSQALKGSEAPTRLRIGERLTQGLGVGGDPEKGAQAAEENRNEIAAALEGASMVFVAAGLGGGTGTGAAPVVAEIARSVGALTIATVTTPFSWEGSRRSGSAKRGLEEIHDNVDAMIVVPNSRLIEICPKNCTVEQAFETADDVLKQAIQAIANVISIEGGINLDFNDVRSVMQNAGSALLAIGEASDENRAVEAARAATSSALLNQSIEGARNVLYNVTHDGNMALSELDMAARVISEVVDPDANIIFGTVIDPEVGDTVKLTVIATGFENDEQNETMVGGSTNRQEPKLAGLSQSMDVELAAYLRRNIQKTGQLSTNGIGGSLAEGR